MVTIEDKINRFAASLLEEAAAIKDAASNIKKGETPKKEVLGLGTNVARAAALVFAVVEFYEFCDPSKLSDQVIEVYKTAGKAKRTDSPPKELSKELEEILNKPYNG